MNHRPFVQVLLFTVGSLSLCAQTNTLPTSGNVGIGTTSPSSILTVATSGNTRPSVTTSNGGGAAQWTFENSSDGNNAWAMGRSQTGELMIEQSTGATFASGTTHQRVVIDTTGNVGIGTTTPGSYKLAVEGHIRARKVVVDSATWPDYVFAEDYRLAPLNEVEAHIRARRHLPGIPSAAEIEKAGVSLGDMQAKLLAKIEELTLHQIAQEKRLAALEQENARLRQQQP